MIKIPRKSHRDLPLNRYYKYVNVLGREFYVKLITNESLLSSIEYRAEVIGQVRDDGGIDPFALRCGISLYNQELDREVGKHIGWSLPSIYMLSDDDVLTEIVSAII